MTTEELFKIVEEMGFLIERSPYVNGVIYITYANKPGPVIVSVREDNMYEVDTTQIGSFVLDTNTQCELYSVVNDYATTPVEERCVKLYRLKLKTIPLGYNKEKIYLHFNIRKGLFDLGDKNEMIGWRATFPMWHIGQMNEEHDILEDFEIEEVEDI